MRRHRITFSVSAAAAVITAVPLLSGCGTEARPGAAAVLGGERISVAEVQSRSQVVRAAQRAHKDGEQMIQNTSWLNRAALDTLIRYRVIERAAQDAGVSVSRREVQQIRAQAEMSTGGKKQLELVLLQQRPLAPQQIDDDMRVQLLLEKVARKLGADLRSPDGQNTVKAALASASKAMKVEVSPRFGTWDHEKIGLAESKEPWLRQVSRKPDAERLA